MLKSLRLHPPLSLHAATLTYSTPCRCFLTDDATSFFLPKQEPIKFKTRKRLRYNAHRFFRVVQDVDAYQQFIDFMPQSRVHSNTRREELGKYKRNVHGGFDATTTIGFNAVSFDYVSKVSYSHPIVPVNFRDAQKLSWRVTSESASSRIFNSMNSEWVIAPC